METAGPSGGGDECAHDTTGTSEYYGKIPLEIITETTFEPRNLGYIFWEKSAPAFDDSLNETNDSNNI
jgi:hypothetical protein